jgi:hypothetical protein
MSARWLALARSQGGDKSRAAALAKKRRFALTANGAMLVSLHCAGTRPTCSGIRAETRQNRHPMQEQAGGLAAGDDSPFGLTCAKLPAFGARFTGAAAFA